MSKNEISPDEAGLLIHKLMQKSIPVVAYYIRNGVQAKVRGFVDSVTDEVGLVVVAKQDSVPVGYLAVPIGVPVGHECRFRYGEKRELPKETRDELADKLGEVVTHNLRTLLRLQSPCHLERKHSFVRGAVTATKRLPFGSQRSPIADGDKGGPVIGVLTYWIRYHRLLRCTQRFRPAFPFE